MPCRQGQDLKRHPSHLPTRLRMRKLIDPTSRSLTQWTRNRLREEICPSPHHQQAQAVAIPDLFPRGDRLRPPRISCTLPSVEEPLYPTPLKKTIRAKSRAQQATHLLPRRSQPRSLLLHPVQGPNRTLANLPPKPLPNLPPRHHQSLPPKPHPKRHPL